MPQQFVDPQVSRAKFDREILEFRALGEEHLRRGWLLAYAEYPRARFVLTAPQTNPPAAVVGVVFDYTNYDAAPPSVMLVHPFTGIPFKLKELPTPLNRALPPQSFLLAGAAPGEAVQPQLMMEAFQPYMQAFDAEDVPFMCVAGVREYHDHPAHSGDLWELHRPSGAGRIVRLLDIISKYGTEAIRSLKVELVPKVSLNFGPPPP